MATAQAWLVRAGQDDEYADAALERGLVGVGWRRVGDLGAAGTLAAVRRQVAHAYPAVAAPACEAYALQLHAFRCTMRPGDPVVLWQAGARELAVGELTGDYAFVAVRSRSGPAHVRLVRWLPRRLRWDAAAPEGLVVCRLRDAGAVTRLLRVAKVRASDVPAAGEAGPGG